NSFSSASSANTLEPFSRTCASCRTWWKRSGSTAEAGFLMQTAKSSDDPAAAVRSGSRNISKRISLAVALVLAAVLLYYSLRGIEWRQVAHIVAGARLALLAVGAGIT